MSLRRKRRGSGHPKDQESLIKEVGGVRRGRVVTKKGKMEQITRPWRDSRVREKGQNRRTRAGMRGGIKNGIVLVPVLIESTNIF